MIQQVLEGISNALYSEFGFQNYIEKIAQDMEEPCFFISCLQPEFRHYVGERYFMECQFAVQYFPKSIDHANEECYGTAQKMLWLLETIQAGNEPLRGSKMKYEIKEGILHFFVNYDFFLHKAKRQDAMGGMQSNVSIKK